MLRSHPTKVNSIQISNIIASDMYSERLIIVIDNLEKTKNKSHFKSLSAVNSPKHEPENLEESDINFDEDQPRKIISKMFRPAFERLKEIKNYESKPFKSQYYVQLGEKDRTNILHEELNDKLFFKFKNEIEKCKNALLNTNIPLIKFEKAKQILDKEYQQVK